MTTKKVTTHQKEIRKQRSIEVAMKKEALEFKRQFADSALKLMTSGFGLVSALAWNELIKEAVKIYIKPYFGESSGLISLLIYAVLVTALAVFITYQLSKIAGKEKE